MSSKVKKDIFEQRMYLKWERGYIVGEMSEVNFLCKKTSSFNFDDICNMFSDIVCNDKTIIIIPGYNYDFSSPFFEVKCSI